MSTIDMSKLDWHIESTPSLDNTDKAKVRIYANFSMRCIPSQAGLEIQKNLQEMLSAYGIVMAIKKITEQIENGISIGSKQIDAVVIWEKLQKAMEGL